MRVEVNGAGYNVEVHGDGPPLMLLHGFTGSARTWDAQVVKIRALAPAKGGWDDHSIVVVDLLGHGQTDAPTDPERYRMERASEDVCAILDTLGHSRAAVLGYSMGGRLALHLAVECPERVAALVLESGSPGIADPVERQERATRDAQLAMFIEREGVSSFVRRWEANPIFESQRVLPEEARSSLRSQRLQNSSVGLANSLRGMGAGAQEPLWDRLDTVAAPTLLLAGEHDRKYQVLLERMWDRLPRVGAAVIPDAGHAVHLEQPDGYVNRVVEFLWGQLPGWNSREEIEWR